MTLNTLKKNARGFTLLELLIVVIIISILAAVAVPQFIKAVKKARASEGISTVGTYLTAEWAHYQENTAFVIADADKAKLLITEPSTGNFTYALSAIAGPPPGVKVVATGKSGGTADTTGITVTGTLDTNGTKTVVSTIS